MVSRQLSFENPLPNMPILQFDLRVLHSDSQSSSEVEKDFSEPFSIISLQLTPFHTVLADPSLRSG